MLTQSKADEVQQLLAAGLSFRRAALVSGVSRGTVHNLAYGRPMVFIRHGDEPRRLRQAVRCPGCGAKLNMLPCVQCSITQTTRAK